MAFLTKRLLLASHGKKQKEGYVFTTQFGEVEISDEYNLLTEILDSINGFSEVQEIVKAFNNEQREYVLEVLQILEKHNLATDSRELFTLFHKWSSNPMTATHDLSFEDLCQLTEESVALPELMDVEIHEEGCSCNSTRAKTCRSFKSLPVSHAVLEQLAANAIGTAEDRATPSAGGLYSLKAYLYVLYGKTKDEEGLFVFDPQVGVLRKTKRQFPRECVKFFMGTSMVDNASFVMVLTADMKRVSQKYSNRAYRFVLLEAGHVCQNFYKEASSFDLGVCEYGGFSDQLVSEALNLTHLEIPLISIIGGFPGKDSGLGFEEDAPLKTVEDELTALVGKVSVDCTVWDSGVKNLFYTAESKVLDSSNNFGLGTSLIPETAVLKSLVEAIERFWSSEVSIDLTGDLPPDYDQINLLKFPQVPSYVEEAGLVPKLPFWKKGYRYRDGGPVCAPVDQVYYGYDISKTEGDVSYLANSTGVAAHTNYETAVFAGLSELCERHAIATAWYGECAPEQIDSRTCSDWIQYRLARLVKSGRSCSLLSLKTEYVPTMLCVISSEEYPHFVFGSAASFDLNQAIDKALTEAEVTLTSSILGGEKLSVEKVESVEDHALFWAGQKNLQELEFLWKGDFVSVGDSADTEKSMKELAARINPGVFRLDNKCGIVSVVRVMADSLMPITFGYGAEHLYHPCLGKAGWKKPYPATVHPLA